jgi:hypothetical protein
VLAKDPTADNLAVFRQQALIVARRKDQAAERLTQLRAENDALEKQFGRNLPVGHGGSSSNAKSSGHVPQGEEVIFYSRLESKENI